MILAKVVGHVVATQKCDELRGSNLLLIVKLDDDQQPMKDQTWVAVDSVGAGMHDIVLAKSTSRSTKSATKPCRWSPLSRTCFGTLKE
jgi:microcompartment protein CcmK/EutM